MVYRAPTTGGSDFTATPFLARKTPTVATPQSIIDRAYQWPTSCLPRHPFFFVCVLICTFRHYAKITRIKSAFIAPATQLSSSCEWRLSCTACRHCLTTLSDSSPQVTLRNTSQLFAAKHCAAAHRCLQDGATAIHQQAACIRLFCLHMHDSHSPIRIAKVSLHRTHRHSNQQVSLQHTIAQRTLHPFHKHHIKVYQVENIE